MHPGPMNRGMEIAAEVADSARSTIVEQVTNGVSVRMAVLYLLLSAGRPASDDGGVPTSEHVRREGRPAARRRAPPTWCSSDGVVASSPAPGCSRAGAEVRRRRRAGRAAGPGRPAHPPARARPRGRRDRRDRHRGRRARRLHRGARDGQHRPGRRHRRRGRAGLAARPRGRALRRAARSARSPSGWRASGWPSSARWPTRAARVRVFSDDGHCVSDAVLMRRALEYVKAFGGVVAQHAQEPRLTEGAQMNEGELSGVLGLQGWPAVAEEAIIARDVLLAAHVGSRLHVCHVSTAGSVEILRWAKSKGWNVTAEVTPHHLLLTDELVARRTTRCSRSTRRCAPPTTSRRCARRSPTAPSTRSPPTTPRTPHEDKDCEWAAAAMGMLGLRDRAVGGAGGDGRDRPARLGRRRRPDVDPAGADRPGSTATAGRSRWARPPTWCSSTRRPGATVDPFALASRSAATRPYAGRTLPGARGRHLPARPADGPRRCARRAESVEPVSCAARRPCWCSRTAARSAASSYGGDRRDVRRGGVLDRDDRLPGDADRPELPPAGRRDDRAAHRQHRRERRGPGVRPDLGQRATSCASRAGARRPGGRSAPWTTSSPPRASSASAASTPARSPGTCASAARCASASARRAPTPAVAAATGCVRARRWPAPTSPARSPLPSRTSWRRPATKRFTVAALDLGIKAMTPRRMAERGIEVHVLPVHVDRGRRCWPPAPTGCSCPTGPATRPPPTARSR